jgi:3-oxoacyl-[acyl-carrier protein] reductase
MNLNLTDKPVIVCASSAGLGRAAALEFAREGANVMLASRREPELRQAAADIQAQTGREVGLTVADVTKPEDIERLVANTVRQFGGVYTLVNNSGGPPAGTFDSFDDTAWQNAFELNLLSYVRAIRAVLPHLRKGGGGRIVNYASSSVKAPLENLILSNTFRTGVMGLTKTLAGELGGTTFWSTCRRPAAFRRTASTTSTACGLQDRRDGGAGSPRSLQDDPAGALWHAGGIRQIDRVSRLAANTYLTGQTLVLDGGMTKAY